MSVTILSAYCETSVERASANVPPMPPRMTTTPTPSVRNDAAALPKTRSRRRKARGSDTSSARCRSTSSAVSMSWLSGMFPVARTSSESERTSARSSPKNWPAAFVPPCTVTLASARFPSFDRSPAACCAGTASGVTTDTTRESARRGSSAAFIAATNRGSVASRPSLLVKIRMNDEVAAGGAPVGCGSSSRRSCDARPDSVSLNSTLRRSPPASKEAMEAATASSETKSTSQRRR